MAFLLRKYKQAFKILSVAVISVFALSSVSIAYTSVFCKMKKAEMEEEGCCCRVEENDKEAVMICSEMSFGNEVRFTQEDGCCCEIKTVEATERNSTNAIAVNTFTKISHDGSLLFELPTPNNTPTLKAISPAGKIISDGRSVLTFNSVLRI